MAVYDSRFPKVHMPGTVLFAFGTIQIIRDNHIYHRVSKKLHTLIRDRSKVLLVSRMSEGFKEYELMSKFVAQHRFYLGYGSLRQFDALYDFRFDSTDPLNQGPNVIDSWLPGKVKAEELYTFIALRADTLRRSWIWQHPPALNSMVECMYAGFHFFPSNRSKCKTPSMQDNAI